MQTLRGSRSPADGEKQARRPSKPLVVSVIVHIVLAIGMANMLISPSAMSRLFGRTQSKQVVAERIGFLRLPSRSGPATEGRSGGDGRPLSESTPPRVVAPAVVPSSIPETPAATPSEASEGGSGPLVGGGGPTRGIRPTYTDPRVWQAPGDIVSAPKSAKERLDSAIVSIIAPFNDSLAVAAQGRKPGDWTFEKDGRKYGIDPQYIRLGKLSIPTAVLALLPINQQANPTVSDRNKLQNQLHADIFWQAQRGMNDADFKKAVRSIRERKERERAAQKKAAQQEEPPAAPTGNDR
jgi:hypothetical protein